MIEETTMREEMPRILATLPLLQTKRKNMTVNRLKSMICLLSFVMVSSTVENCRSAEPQANETKEPEDSSPKDEMAKKRQEIMFKAMQKSEVVMDGDDAKRATLDSKAMLRWSNPLGDVADGLMSVYSTGPTERPAMIVHLYVHGSGLNGLEMQEFADVHPGPVELLRGRQKVWSPRSRYSTFQKLPDAPKPSDNAGLRLGQIKQMAARFEIIDGFREPNSEPKPHVLRMMSRPTYRYGSPTGEIIDGALFTYVVATDPEACLLIEIHRKAEVISWEYMVLPMTIYSLEATLDGKSVWTKPEAMVFGDSTAPHFISSYRRDAGEPALKTLFPSQ
jgi:hypothetical protein